MKIKMITLAASPNGNLLAGHEYGVPGEVSQSEANALVSGGYAVVVKSAAVVEPVTTPNSESIETADLKVPAEAESADLLTVDSKADKKPAPEGKNSKKKDQSKES